MSAATTSAALVFLESRALGLELAQGVDAGHNLQCFTHSLSDAECYTKAPL